MAVDAARGLGREFLLRIARSAPDAVIASGLAPVFGLMRNVNLAYGLNLLGVMNAFLE